MNKYILIITAFIVQIKCYAQPNCNNDYFTMLETFSSDSGKCSLEYNGYVLITHFSDDFTSHTVYNKKKEISYSDTLFKTSKIYVYYYYSDSTLNIDIIKNTSSEPVKVEISYKNDTLLMVSQLGFELLDDADFEKFQNFISKYPKTSPHYWGKYSSTDRILSCTIPVIYEIRKIDWEVHKKGILRHSSFIKGSGEYWVNGELIKK